MQRLISKEKLEAKVLSGASNHEGKYIEGSNQLYVSRGDGYTNVIQKALPGYSGEDYLEAHQAALRQFGPNYIRGISHYEMSNGGVGLLRTGNVTIEAGTKSFLQDYLIQH